ncbi:unnamed protein product [Periconia digitata]|uniref:non-specific serine/threonine protein kinase n=1 Tax=Periconia digitata TaxID=1303443 RepID=A0A9W4XGI8_9PLEO|nr:unnamed protein product [Periconia digitata]
MSKAYKMEYHSLDVVREIQESDGCNNEGILLVRDNTRQRLLIEKRFKLYDVWNGPAQKEIEILKQLRGHPNITSIEGWYLQDGSVEETKGSVWLDYCNQGTLSNAIDFLNEQDREFSEFEIWHVFAQLAEAVRFCQQGPIVDVFSSTLATWNPIYHLDISPSNVFLTVDHGCETMLPRVLLGDFGCSATHFSQLQNGAILAADSSAEVDKPFLCMWQNAEFAAPESPYFSLKSDIYQLGLVIYCMLAMRTWGMDADFDANLRKADQYSEELRGLVGACLEQDPAQRLNITQLMGRIASGLQAEQRRRWEQPAL